MKKATVIVLSCMLFFACLAFTASAEDIAVSEDSRIVIPADAAETERYAAEVLQKQLLNITGKELSIAADSEKAAAYEFAVGKTNRFSADLSGKKDGSYVIKSYDGGVAILGEGTRGTIYGVYGFLEKYCGCNWYTSQLAVVPENKSLSLPSDIDAAYDTYFEYTDTDWISPRDAEYSLANGLSGGVYRKLTQEQGGTVDYISGFCHTLATQFCSQDTYFESHPEYFALHDGKRTPDQLCLTNEAVYNVVLDEVMALLKEKHDPKASVQIISLTQSDNKNYCQCESCAAIDAENGSQAGTMITFVNRIADKVAEAGYGNIALDTFAYQYTRHTPTKAVPRDNVIVRLCTIECCFSHALDDESCEDNVSLMADLKAWSKICDRIYVWDYATNYAHTFGIFPDFGVIQRNLQVFYENGVKGVYEEGNYYMGECDTEFGELRSYLLSKLMQNPYCDYDAAMNSFLSAYYGAGGENVRAFIDGITAAAANSHIHIYDKMNDIVISKEQIAEFDALWSDAESKADDTAAANIKRSELCWRYWKACTNSGEFSGIKRFSERKALYNDIVATGAVKKSEGSKDFDKLSLAEIVNNPSDWSSGKSAVTNIFYALAGVFYAITLFASLLLFISAIRKKKWLYLVHLPLLSAAFELIMWNKRAFIAWKDIGEYAVTLIIYAALFAFLSVCLAKAKGKLSRKEVAVSAVAGASAFLVAYNAPVFIINIGIYHGTANSLALSVALLFLSIISAVLLIKTAKLVNGKKQKTDKDSKITVEAR